MPCQPSPRRFALRALVATLALSLPAIAAVAGGLQKQRVAADAEWVAHFDVRGLLNSKLGKKAMEDGAQVGLGDADIDEIKAQLGIDPYQDIIDVTIYGAGNPEDGNLVVLATTTPAVEDAIAKLKEQAGEAYRQVEEAGYALHVIEEEEESTFFFIAPGHNTGERTVLIAKTGAALVQGLRVLEGKAPNLESGRDAKLAVAPQAGSLLYVSARAIGWIEEGDETGSPFAGKPANGVPASAILRKADGVTVDFGESGEETFLDLAVATASEDEARNLADIGRGLMALGRMAAGQEPDVAPLAETIKAFRLDQKDHVVSLRFRCDTDELIKVMEMVAAMSEGDDADVDVDEDNDGAEVKIDVQIGDNTRAKEKKPQ